MDKKHIELVQASWSHIEVSLDEIVTSFYDELFLMAPHFRELFNKETLAQRKMLASALCAIVTDLNDPQRSRFYLVELGKKHAGYGVKEEDLKVFGDAWLKTLSALLGEDFDGETQQAWVACYTWIRENMSLGLIMAAD